ncbi:uncharacterized protein JCM6883_006916 [Sporobolomyces salmoneus]|uniref:uncharacterized protein n=1 Tax=Sporobolomyces salmoneus TaxID=183962 RepID=UPI00317148B1
MESILSSLPSEIPIQLQGVFVHPDHFSSFADEIPSPCSSVDSSSILSYGTDDDDMKEFATREHLYRDDRSAEQDSSMDYFAPRRQSSSSSFYTGFSDDSTYSSEDGASFSSVDQDEEEEEDVVTTPTPGSCYQPPSFSRRSSSSSYSETYPDLTAPVPSFPASFAFNTFAPSATSSRPSSRPASPSRRAHPYAKSSSAMARSVSSPVETNRQVEARKNAMLAFTASMDERAKMVRSKSTPNAPPTPGCGVAMSRSAASSRAPVAPFLTPFEDNWGSALPPRVVESSPMLPFPYNLACPPSRFRLNRANSYAGTENHFEAPKVERHGSVPTISISGPPSTLSSSSASSGMTRSSSRRSSILRPLTPIVQQPSASQDGVCSALESFTFSPSPSSPPQMVRARLNRGLSF